LSNLELWHNDKERNIVEASGQAGIINLDRIIDGVRIKYFRKLVANLKLASNKISIALKEYKIPDDIATSHIDAKIAEFDKLYGIKSDAKTTYGRIKNKYMDMENIKNAIRDMISAANKYLKTTWRQITQLLKHPISETKTETVSDCNVVLVDFANISRLHWESGIKQKQDSINDFTKKILALDISKTIFIIVNVTKTSDAGESIDGTTTIGNPDKQVYSIELKVSCAKNQGKGGPFAEDCHKYEVYGYNESDDYTLLTLYNMFINNDFSKDKIKIMSTDYYDFYTPPSAINKGTDMYYMSPKGVAINHENIRNILKPIYKLPHITESSNSRRELSTSNQQLFSSVSSVSSTMRSTRGRKPLNIVDPSDKRLKPRTSNSSTA
jgi:hypothetical protein